MAHGCPCCSGGYFDDLASHGLNLFTYFFGAISTASGVSLNQQQLYTAKDAISGVWQHENGITGMGNWNFGSATRADRVKIYGSEGQLEFSVFDEHSIRFENATEYEQLSIRIQSTYTCPMWNKCARNV